MTAQGESPLPVDLRAALRGEDGWHPPVRDVRFYVETTSTNDVAMALARLGGRGGTVVIADRQTAGRGRSGHRWFSPPEAGLYATLVLDHDWPGPVSNGWLTLSAGVAVVRALHAVAGLDAALKWPNDVIVPRHGGWRKVAGVLAEGVVRGQTVDGLVLGVGVNVRRVAIPDDLQPVLTSIEAETGLVPARGGLLAAILRELDGAWRTLSAGDTASLRAEWTTLSPSAHGARVRWREGEVLHEGETAGLDLDGALLVADRRGRCHRLVGGRLDWC